MSRRPTTSSALALLATLLLAATLAGCGVRGRSIPASLPTLSGKRTVIYAADGTPITELAGDERRETVPLDRIPQVLQNAVIAIEDERFWQHDGVDPKGIVRAAVSNSDEGGAGQGGSTITQQYVKNALLTPEKNIQRKIQEASLARQLERTYSKQFILEQYLNTIFFGNRAYGVQVAAQTYLGHGVDTMSLAEAALLAGLIQSPSRYNPFRSPDRAVARRNVVLRKMRELGYVDQAAADAAVAEPLRLATAADAAAAVRYPAAHFVDEVKRFIRSDPRFGATEADRENLLLNGGLSIYTTIDLGLQAKAEEAVTAVYPDQARKLDDRRKDPDVGLVAIQPDNGFVRAMVGGYDYFDTDNEVHPYAQYNLAVGKGRQAGSTFKIPVLAAALAKGVKPTERFPSPAVTTIRYPGQKPWRVSGHGAGNATLSACVSESLNTCFGNLIADERVGPEWATEFAGRMGIDVSYDPATGQGFKPFLSLVLGSNDSTVLDMTESYAVIANRGLHSPATMVTKVVDASGTVLYQHRHAQEKLLEPEAVDAITEMMEQVLVSGTAAGRGIDRPAAGKTGTTQDSTDAWFVGFTPDLVTGVWAGYSQTTKRKVGSTGATAAAPVWQRFMRAAHEGLPPRPFDFSATPPVPTTTVPKSNTELFEPVTDPVTVDMPALVGVNVNDASARARRAGVVLQRRDVAVPPGGLPGQVLGQSPAAGTKVPKGARVVIEATPGKPPPSGPVPDLRGQPAPDVVAQLTQQGYTVTQAVEPSPPGFVLPSTLPPVSAQVWAIEPAPGQISVDGKLTVRIQP